MLGALSEPGAVAEGVSRRDFLRVGGLSVLGLSVPEQLAAQQARAEADGKRLRRCLMILMTGGPSPLETFDPKPQAPAEIRGPYRGIATATPGIWLSETLPLLARRSDHFALIRSLTSEAAPIHETGLQLLQTGRLSRTGATAPSLGSIVSRLLGPRGEVSPYVVLPHTLGSTGVTAWQGQGAGFLGSEFEPRLFSTLTETANLPLVAEESAGLRESRNSVRLPSEPDSVRRQYGDTEFGLSCLQARRLLEQGVRFVTVNMFATLSGGITWDCHGHRSAAPATVQDYGATLCPEFDRVFSAQLDDLGQRGLLEETLVVAAGEFGRTPRLNPRGGRDHWCNVWSALLAGGGIRGGRVLGASDARGSTPAERPVAPAELAATILHSLGIDLSAQLGTPNGTEFPVAVAPPLAELLS